MLVVKKGSVGERAGRDDAYDLSPREALATLYALKEKALQALTE